MGKCVVTLTQRPVEHEDAVGAGFGVDASGYPEVEEGAEPWRDGWWCTVTCPGLMPLMDHPTGRFETGQPTQVAAEIYARRVAAGYGHEGDDVVVLVGEPLMSRADDEARVLALLAAESAVPVIAAERARLQECERELIRRRNPLLASA